MAHSSLRFGMGRFTTEAEVDFVVQRIVAVVNRLREMRLAFFSLPGLRELKASTAHCGRWCKRASTSAASTGRSRNIEYLLLFFVANIYSHAVTLCIHFIR